MKADENGKTKPNYAGVWPLFRAGRPKPFGVQWRAVEWDKTTNVEVTKTKTEFFETEEQRDARRAVIVRERAKRVGVLTRGDIDDWHAFKTAVGGTPWQHVVAGWQSWMVQHGMKQCAVTVDQAVKESISTAELAVQRNQLSPDTFRQKSRKQELFAEQFGHLTLDEVKAPDVEAWIDDFDEVQTEATFNNYRKHVRSLFEPYVRNRTILINPIAEVRKRDDSGGDVGILTVQQTAYLFKFALESDKFRVAIGRLALEAFVGLRFSSGCRLEKKDINFDDRGILLPKHKLKTKKRHYLDGIPGQLWDWLAVTPDECWILTARQYMELKTCLFVEAGVPHPHNCFRHSFTTYDVAAHKNPGRTAYLLCHSNQELLWERYKGNAREEDGKAYQTITPQTVEKLAKGYVPIGRAAPPAEKSQTPPAPSG